MAILIDGYRTIVAPVETPNISFRERTVTPPELDGGGPINTQSMWNIKMRTQAPKALYTSGPMTLSVFWDPFIYTQLLNAVLGVNQKWQVIFPNQSALVFYGWLDKFTPPEMTEGTEPLAEMTILPSHAIGVRGTGAEYIPLYQAPTVAYPAQRI